VELVPKRDAVSALLVFVESPWFMLFVYNLAMRGKLFSLRDIRGILPAEFTRQTGGLAFYEQKS
jgi:hypothetical protein